MHLECIERDRERSKRERERGREKERERERERFVNTKFAKIVVLVFMCYHTRCTGTRPTTHMVRKTLVDFSYWV